MVESLLFLGAGAGSGVEAGLPEPAKKVPGAGQKRTGSATLRRISI